MSVYCCGWVFCESLHNLPLVQARFQGTNPAGLYGEATIATVERTATVSAAYAMPCLQSCVAYAMLCLQSCEQN